MTDKNRNLLVRVVTALILLPLVILLIWLAESGSPCSSASPPRSVRWS